VVFPSPSRQIYE